MQAFGLYKLRSVDLGTLTFNMAENSFTVAACDTYIENTNAVIEIDSLKQYNYEAPTDSVRIYIRSKEGYNVAQIE